jgi:DnaJ-class molecular chaperone
MGFLMNPWKILGVSRQSSDEEIRSAYLALARKHHPDKGGDGAKFTEINEAYAILKDRKRCSLFIKDLLVWNKECVACKGKGALFKQKGFANRSSIPCSACGGAGVLIEKRRVE